MPIIDKYWIEAADSVRVDSGDRLMAPIEFRERFDNVLPYKFSYTFQPEDFSCIVIHKGRCEEFRYEFLQRSTQVLKPIFANEVFVVFSTGIEEASLPSEYLHLKSFWAGLEELSESHKSEEQMAKSYSERVVHFIHLPRTGGTSIRRQLVDKIFKSWEVFPAQQYDELGRWDEYYFPEHGPLSTSLLNSYKFYSGHFGGWVLERLVEKPVSAFTLLRDPIEQIASFYQYFLQSILEEHQLLIRENPEAFQDLASFVNSPYCPFNQQTRVLGYDPGEKFQSLLLGKRTYSSLGGILPPITTDEPLEIFKLAKKRLETCSVVGVTAHREQFFQKLQDIYGWQLDSKININIANPKQYKSVSMESYLRDFIRDRQYWDYKLYELALEISHLD